MTKQRGTCVVLAAICGLQAGAIVASEGDHKVPAARVVWQLVTPDGVTLTITGSTAFQPSGVADFPVSVSFGAAAVAVGR